jgi:hypothetical protein
MANYQTIMRLRPYFREFELQRRLIFRGDVLFFPPNYRSETFSTDARGFRHTSFAGEDLTVADILQRERYGLVLGGSRAFGIGIAGNENTMPSILSERFGFPFANVTLPQGNSRNLSSLLYAFVSRAPKPPAAVVHFSSGDLTGHSYSSMADPVFGSPNPKLVPIIAKERGGLPAPEHSVQPMLAFTSLWTKSIALMCRSQGVPMVLANDSSFFEKRKPSARDRECELGKPTFPADKRWFDGHKAFAGQYYERRAALAEGLGIPLAGPGASNDLGFIDEFHFDEEGTRALTDDIAGALEPLLEKVDA